jgi:hypothetical protein
MSISGISSGASSLGYVNPWQDELQQRLANYRALQDAMKKGDLAAAQKAYAALQQNAQLGGQDPSGQLFGNNDQLNSDFSALGDALQSGNMNDAKTAFAKLQQDMQATRDAAQKKGGHHHHHGGTTVTVSETITISTNQTVVAGAGSNDNDNNGDSTSSSSSGSAVTGVLNITA